MRAHDPATVPPIAALSPGEVAVWLVALDDPAADSDDLATVLSPAERARAERMAFPELRRRFVAAHAALRGVLGAALGCPPADVVLEEAGNGKPFVPGSSVEFNLSHSAERALVAVGAGVEVGVDVEAIRPLWSWAALARRILAPGERVRVPDEDVTALLRVWARKEAVLKASGDGLRVELASVDVLSPSGSVEVLGRPWVLHDLDAGEGYAAAVAVPPGARLVTPSPVPFGMAA